ncbi:MAG: hypothetical protein WBV85_10035 [Solirubrobacteraceae bacterium]
MTSSRLSKLLVLSVLAAASFAAVGTSAALAANEIAYDCSKLDICLLDPANPAAVTNLTDNGETSIDEKPVWSPDGKKVAFISNFGVGGSTRNLFVMEPEAPEQGFNLAVQVTHFTSGVPLEEPVWSPDGTRLAFVLGNSESNDKIEVANSNGTTATPLVVTEHGVHPSWSPDSGKIAFSYLEHISTTVADGSAFPTRTVRRPRGRRTVIRSSIRASTSGVNRTPTPSMSRTPTAAARLPRSPATRASPPIRPGGRTLARRPRYSHRRAPLELPPPWPYR